MRTTIRAGAPPPEYATAGPGQAGGNRGDWLGEGHRNNTPTGRRPQLTRRYRALWAEGAYLGHHPADDWQPLGDAAARVVARLAHGVRT